MRNLNIEKLLSICNEIFSNYENFKLIKNSLTSIQQEFELKRLKQETKDKTENSFITLEGKVNDIRVGSVWSGDQTVSKNYISIDIGFPKIEIMFYPNTSETELMKVNRGLNIKAQGKISSFFVNAGIFYISIEE